MIKLSNIEAQALLSPIAVNLFGNSDNKFPSKDIFLILDIVKLIEDRMVTYYKQLRKIIEENNGTIEANNKIEYATDEDRKAATEKIIELNQIKLEYPFEPFDRTEVDESWPDLCLAEASILKPLIRNGKK